MLGELSVFASCASANLLSLQFNRRFFTQVYYFTATVPISQILCRFLYLSQLFNQYTQMSVSSKYFITLPVDLQIHSDENRYHLLSLLGFFHPPIYHYVSPLCSIYVHNGHYNCKITMPIAGRVKIVKLNP